MTNKEKARKKLNKKKAQIGSTITWIGAFLIIFFILLLFLSASVVISKTKKVLGANYRISAETIEQESLMQSRMLVTLLNSHITISYNNAEKEATIKNSLEVSSLSEMGQESIKNQIENNLLELAKYSKPECYLLKISSKKNEIMEYTSKLFLIKSGYYEKADVIYLRGKEGQIEIKLFVGRC
ncbi:hypothetical protein HYT26_00580 [Candidatus Pacearchaeota archaeon]|nr:hypothetical protein [Candidatus Pacearchaeota archaeon]